MKATRETIPFLIKEREEFSNDSGTLWAVKSHLTEIVNETLMSKQSQLNETEKSRFRIDAHQNGMSYIVFSYGTPIAWETRAGDFYIIKSSVSQTTDQHVGLARLSEVVD